MYGTQDLMSYTAATCCTMASVSLPYMDYKPPPLVNQIDSVTITELFEAINRKIKKQEQ